MGWFSWMFPSPEQRAQRARGMLDSGRPDEARLEALEVDHPEARAVLSEAECQLAIKNLEAAVSWGRAGDDYRVQTHLELANTFHSGGLEDEFRNARRILREIRADRSAAEQRDREQEQARLLSVDPVGMLGGPSLLDPALDDGLLDADRDELEARLGLLVEGYPESLRGGVRELGAPFARAVLDLDEGRADLALQALIQLADDEPLVLWERARTARALGDPRAAALAAAAFARHADGHQPMGNTHSAIFLAQVLAETGDLQRGLRVLRDARAAEPKLGGVLYAQILEATGELQEAEKVLTTLIRQHPRSSQLYVLLARVRIAGGHPNEAMRALEASLEATHCSPGKCGYTPPSLAVHRMLATLYFEAGIETERALELSGIAQGLVEKPAWEDAYLAALAARGHRDPSAGALAQRLSDNTPRDDPRRTRLEAHLLTG